MPKTGIVATPTSNMSKNWILHKKIDVKPNKNIKGMFNASGIAARLPQSLIKYILQGTCLLSTSDMAAYLSLTDE